MTKLISQPIDIETPMNKICNNSIIIMNNINKLSYTRALKYIDRKILEYTNKKSYDKINKSKYVDTIKQLRQKRKEINKKIEKLEKENNMLVDVFDENKQLKKELQALKKEYK